MTGPKDIIRRASMQHRQEDRTPAERAPAPAPMQVRQAPFVQPTAQMRTSGAMERQMPPLSAGFKENVRAAAPETGEQGSPAKPAVERRPVPQNMGSHAIYSGLMRSHDRMGTRHLDSRG